jgi:hypothetical protein
MIVLYKRIVEPKYPYDTASCTHRDHVHEFTGGIIHMLDSDRWMTRDEVIAEAVKYNATFDGMLDGQFEIDPLVVAEYLGLLCQVGMVVARIVTEGEE